MTETRKVTDNPTGADSKGAVEADVQRILEIDGSEVLGHDGRAREEHSGQNSPRKNPEPADDFADNRPDQIDPEKE